jgi:hypothetical protein
MKSASNSRSEVDWRSVGNPRLIYGCWGAEVPSGRISALAGNACPTCAIRDGDPQSPLNVEPGRRLCAHEFLCCGSAGSGMTGGRPGLDAHELPVPRPLVLV